MFIPAQKLLPQYSSITGIQRFSSVVLNDNCTMTPKIFADELGKVKKIYLKNNQYDLFCEEANCFADKLISSERNDLAGIIISSLCKLTEFIPEKLEKFAQKGYEIAKRNGDYVHMMSRLNNLRKIYQGHPDRLYDYVQVLYKQEKCLKELTFHYDTAVGSYHSLVRKPATKNEYEVMLAYVQTEIGKLTRKKHPEDALKKLLNARDIFEKHKNYRNVGYIDMLILKINNNI